MASRSSPHREQQPAHGRQASDRLAELDARAGVLVGLPVGGLGDAEGLRGHGQPGAVHQVHGVAHEAEAALAEQGGRGVDVLDLARRRRVDPHLVLDAPDLDRVVALDQEHGEAAGVGRALLAAGQDQRNVRQAVGDEALDAVEVPLAGGLVQGCPRPHGAQVGSGVGLGQDHRPGDLAAREARQHPRLGLRVADLLQQGGDLLEAVHGHEAALRPGHHLHHHLVDGLGQVQAAVLAGQHGPEELGLAQGIDGVLGGGGIGDLAAVVVGALLVRLGGPGCHALAADLAEDVEHDPVVVDGVRVVARGGGVDLRLGVALLLELQHLAQVELLAGGTAGPGCRGRSSRSFGCDLGCSPARPRAPRSARAGP